MSQDDFEFEGANNANTLIESVCDELSLPTVANQIIAIQKINQILIYSGDISLFPSFLNLIKLIQERGKKTNNIDLKLSIVQFFSLVLDTGFSIESLNPSFLSTFAAILDLDYDKSEVTEVTSIVVSFYKQWAKVSPSSLIATKNLTIIVNHIDEYKGPILSDFSDIINYCCVSLQRNDMLIMNSCINAIITKLDTIEWVKVASLIPSIERFFISSDKFVLPQYFKFYSSSSFLDKLMSIYKDCKQKTRNYITIRNSIVNMIAMFSRNSRHFANLFIESKHMAYVITSFRDIMEKGEDKSHILMESDGTIYILSEEYCLTLFSLFTFISMGCKSDRYEIGYVPPEDLNEKIYDMYKYVPFYLCAKPSSTASAAVVFMCQNIPRLDSKLIRKLFTENGSTIMKGMSHILKNAYSIDMKVNTIHLLYLISQYPYVPISNTLMRHGLITKLSDLKCVIENNHEKIDYSATIRELNFLIEYHTHQSDVISEVLDYTIPLVTYSELIRECFNECHDVSSYNKVIQNCYKSFKEIFNFIITNNDISPTSLIEKKILTILIDFVSHQKIDDIAQSECLRLERIHWLLNFLYSEIIIPHKSNLTNKKGVTINIIDNYMYYIIKYLLKCIDNYSMNLTIVRACSASTHLSQFSAPLSLHLKPYVVTEESTLSPNIFTNTDTLQFNIYYCIADLIQQEMRLYEQKKWLETLRLRAFTVDNEYKNIKFYFRGKELKQNIPIIQALYNTLEDEDPMHQDISLFWTVTLDLEMYFMDPSSIPLAIPDIILNKEVPIVKRADNTLLSTTNETKRILVITDDIVKSNTDTSNKKPLQFSMQLITCLEMLDLLYKYNDYIQEYGFSEFINNPFDISHFCTLIPRDVFISTYFTSLLHTINNNSIILITKAVPKWLEYLLYNHNYLFLFADKQDYFFSTSFSVSDLCAYIQNHNPNWKNPIQVNSRLIRFTVQRFHVIMDMIYLGNMYNNSLYLQIKFYDEEGVGQGPTREFISMVSSELQRHELGIWRDKEPFIQTNTRFLNYPQFGPGEDMEDTKIVEDAVCGVYSRCSKCLAIDFFVCPTHHQLCKHDRKHLTIYCPLCDYKISIKDLECSTCNSDYRYQKLSWLYINKENLKIVKDYFASHPNSTKAYLGLNECSICDAMSVPYIGDKEIEPSNMSSIDLLHSKTCVFHLHEDNQMNHFNCVIRSTILRKTVDKLDLVFANNPEARCNPDCTHFGSVISTEHIQSSQGLFPQSIYTIPNINFEENKTIWFSFGVLIGFALKKSLSVDVPMSSLFLNYIRDGIPTIKSIEEGIHYLSLIDNQQARSFIPLLQLYQQYETIYNNTSMSEEEKEVAYESIRCPDGTTLDDLCIDYNFPGTERSLVPELTSIPGHEDDLVDIHSLPLYLSRYITFSLTLGIEPIIKLIHSGLTRVFPVETFKMFTISELDKILNGEMKEWTRELLTNNIHAVPSAVKQKPQFQYLINILLGFTPEQKVKFIQFCTGAKTLPVGGLVNLHPPLQLQLVQTPDGKEDKIFPTAATCSCLLRIPPYSSEDIFRERLLKALDEGANNFALF